MNKIILKKIPVYILLVALLATFGFLTGFVYPGGPINTDIMTYNEENPEGTEEDDESGEEEEQDEVEKWVCGICGYIYDPAVGDPENGIIEGTEFKDLPETWVCPACSASKLEFENENEEQIEKDEWLAHLEHVLEMRSKHLVVLQRVINNMIVKNPLHPSVLALQHALLSSSKSVQKAQEAIDQYEEQLDDSDDNTDSEDQDNETTDSEDQDDETISNTTTQNNDLKNNDLKENNGNGTDKSENKNKENKGKGKNK